MFFVGPLPPPVHGFSAICQTVLDLVRARAPVVVLDRAPARARGGSKWRSLWAVLVFAGRLICARASMPLYLGLSGGMGQWIDVVLLSAARMRGRPVFLHHHSYAYVRESTLRSRLVFAAASRATHLVLSDGMGRGLAARYGLPPASMCTLSNAAFMPASEPAGLDKTPSASLRIGYLSNITREKGIFRFFETLDELDARGVRYEAAIAGPVDASIQAAFREALAAHPSARHVGPVYGGDKTRFLASLDVLLFPSNYVNEAEPLVVHEALARGVWVASCDRGAIAEVLLDGAGLALSWDGYAAEAADALAKLAASPSGLAEARRCAAARATALRTRALSRLDTLLEALAKRQQA